MSDFIIYKLDEFKKDLKKLKKRFPTIDEDLETMIKTQLTLTHKIKIDNKGTFPIKGLGIDGQLFYKVKKFPCRSLKGKGAKSGIRVIYTYFESDNRIELIEIYYKQDKESEDRDRIIKHYK
jgi:hypothetical protein